VAAEHRCLDVGGDRRRPLRVITCSALRRAYRDLLREGRPEVVFCHLVANPGLIGERMERRVNHYMPASLLPSQLATLEPLEPDEPGVVISVAGEAAEVIAQALAGLGLARPGTNRGPSEGNT
jgi:gluconokinase